MNRLIKKRMLIISISLAFLLLINIGVSYSYYLGKVVGNESDTTIGFKSTGIVINYENNSDNIDASNVAPGWSATKNFSISSTVLENQLNETTSNLWYEIYLYVEKNDFPSNLVTYTFSTTGNNVGNGLVAESRTNIGLPLSTELNVITIGTGNVAVGENVHNYSITFNYSNENYENGNYPDCIFNAHLKVSAIINSIINLNLDGGEIEGDTTKYVSKGGTITLQTPVKENAVFAGWAVTTGDATVNGNELTVNDAIVEVQAKWISRTIAYSILNVNLDGGTWSGGDNLIQTETNTIIKLERPTKPYYTFQGWEIVEGNAEISGDNIVAYDSKVVIKAIFVDMVPMFTYKKSDGTDANYIILRDDETSWRIKFLQSGTLNFQSLGNVVNNKIDAFLVGGGGGGCTGRWANGVYRWVAGGSGGFSQIIDGYVVLINENYNITIGSGGGGTSVNNVDGNGYSGSSTSAFGISVGGGEGGVSKAASGPYSPTDRSVYEFNGSSGNLYGKAGTDTPAENNTGNGAGGNSNSIFSGGSGIVIIRNHRE